MKIIKVKKPLLKYNLLLKPTLFLFLIFANFWIWQLFQEKNFLTIVFLIVISFLFYCFLAIKNRIRKTYLPLTLLLIIFLSVSILYFAKSKTVFSFDYEEVFLINQRRTFYPKQTARIFENKATYVLEKYSKNIFQGLDLNYYFFANNPRERAGIKEVDKFPWVLLPFFLFGLYRQIQKRIYYTITYFLSVIFVGSLFVEIDKIFLLSFPFFVFSIFLGLQSLIFKDG